MLFKCKYLAKALAFRTKRYNFARKQEPKI